MVRTLKKLSLCLLVMLFVVFPSVMTSAQAISFEPDFNVKTEAVILYNLDNNVSVYEKNVDKKMYPASLTKVMTYIITAEHIMDLKNTEITVPDRVIKSLEGTESSLSGIVSGETLTAYDLLNCLMLPSGNDAATVLADYVGGGNVDSFVEMMNQKAKEIGCTNTHFVNPSGLHDENHYTTANDYCKITKYAMQLPYFMTIASQTEYQIPKTNKQASRTLLTTNKMMLNYDTQYYYQYVSGIKTGWHDDAGYCIVTSATADGYSYLCVALGAPTESTNYAMIDSRSLYRWALTTFENKAILDAKEPVEEVTLNYAWGQDTVLVYPEKDISYLLPKDVEASSIKVDVTDLPDSIDAPLSKGDIVGTAKLTYAKKELMEINLVVDSDVSRSDIIYCVHIAKTIFSSPLFIVIFILLVILIVAYIVVTGIYNRKSSSRVKRYRK